MSTASLFIPCVSRRFLDLNEKNIEWINLLLGVSVSRGVPVISYMLFADDSYIYYNANVEEASQVISLFCCFERALGQHVNLLKSLAF